MLIKSKELERIRLQRVWKGMRGRCNNKNSSNYHRYGGRGISICSEWSDFEEFYSWAISNGHSKELSIDRINNDGNYEPSNCRWATRKEQSNNSIQNVRYTHNGKTMNQKQWAAEIGISRECLKYRIDAHGIEKALSMGPEYGGGKTLKAPLTFYV